MKKLIIGLFLLVGVLSWGQQDTLEYTNPREVADIIFGLLDEQLYNNVLIDRSLSEDSLLIQQLNGDYTGIANAWSWIQGYSDISVSYTDSSEMMATSLLIDSLSYFISDYDKMDSTERIYHPFGILLHRVSRIDSNLYHQAGAFINQNNQLKLAPSIDESQIYDKVILKEAALLELYGNHGYETGVIVFQPNFISVGADVNLHNIQIDVGNGFQDFSSNNNEIEYDIYQDWQIGKVILDYSIDNNRIQDTLSFYLTTEIYKYSESNHNEKGKHRWDQIVHFESFKYGKLKYGIRYGCGNNNKIRRPVIIAPPYRPRFQNVSMNKYYDQFDFKSLLSSLADMGYDVIFIKEKPGNRAIYAAGDLLAEFLKHINLAKKENYPNEDWENTVIGLSAGGQQWRWALKSMEKEHMDSEASHHHTRLYIPFDSPHWGANVPMFAQAVYYDFNASGNALAAIIYLVLKDNGSRSMLRYHIAGSTISEEGIERLIEPAPDAKRQYVMNNLNDSFNHQFTPTNDLRKTFPSFTRNVAISVGHNSKDYNVEYGLNPGKKLFEQESIFPGFWGPRKIERRIYASQYSHSSSTFVRKDFASFVGIPVWRRRHYKTQWAYEWDMAQGGYKNEFYDQMLFPVSPIAILRSANFTAIGSKYYDGHMSFLPLVSALAINPTTWENNNLYYNVKDEGLMYNKFDFTIGQDESNTFGYPNLAHPNDHFNITPFEAIFTNPQTYQHIKMQQSVEDDNLDETYLVHLRNFILDEVESDIVYLQNKIIGKNHIQGDSNFRYKAWYKATDQIVFGDSVTPKTDVGPYIIEETGEITAYACNSISLEPGFHTMPGSKFHAFVYCDDCSRPKEHGAKTNNDRRGNESRMEEGLTFLTDSNNLFNNKEGRTVLKVYPNPSENGFTIEFPEVTGEYIISNTNGKLIQENKVLTKTTFVNLPKGTYIVKWINKDAVQTRKIIAL